MRYCNNPWRKIVVHRATFDIWPDIWFWSDWPSKLSLCCCSALSDLRENHLIHRVHEFQHLIITCCCHFQDGKSSTKPNLSSSKSFFTQLQEDAQSQIKKRKTDSSSKKSVQRSAKLYKLWYIINYERNLNLLLCYL